MIDGSKPARRESLQGFDTPTEGEVLSLVEAGNPDGGIGGWNFKWGATGLCPLGGGYFYISENARSKETRQQSSTVRLYEWTAMPQFRSGRWSSILPPLRIGMQDVAVVSGCGSDWHPSKTQQG